MHQILTYSPGQKVTATFETFDATGVRADVQASPIVRAIYFPNGSLGSTSAVVVSKVFNGVYRLTFTLPLGAIAVGNFLLDVMYVDPSDGVTVKYILIEIQVSAPLGNFTVSPA